MTYVFEWYNTQNALFILPNIYWCSRNIPTVCVVDTLTFIPPSFLRLFILLGVPPMEVPEPPRKLDFLPTELGLRKQPIGLFLDGRPPFSDAEIARYMALFCCCFVGFMAD